ncbi:MAG: DUF924 family protein [Polyangiales bacterium]
MLPAMEDARAVVEFWREAGEDKWWRKDQAFDQEFRARFLALHEQAAAGQLESWLGDASSALALLILLDQFPRNAFRGTARMFATDALARRYADAALSQGFDKQVDGTLHMFFYMPFEHSESLPDQERSVRLQEHLGAELHKYAVLHQDIIQRFGRFPHRNALLGRATTPEEQAFLDGGGFSG